jgi:hypothetical protein
VRRDVDEPPLPRGSEGQGSRNIRPKQLRNREAPPVAPELQRRRMGRKARVKAAEDCRSPKPAETGWMWEDAGVLECGCPLPLFALGLAEPRIRLRCRGRVRWLQMPPGLSRDIRWAEPQGPIPCAPNHTSPGPPCRADNGVSPAICRGVSHEGQPSWETPRGPYGQSPYARRSSPSRCDLGRLKAGAASSTSPPL